MPRRPLARLRRTLVNHWRRLWRRELGVIRLRISAPLPLVGAQPVWWQRRVLGQAPAMTLDSWRSLVDRIIADPRSHTVLIEIEAAPGGWATIASLRGELARLRAAGRRVVASKVPSRRVRPCRPRRWPPPLGTSPRRPDGELA